MAPTIPSITEGGAAANSGSACSALRDCSPIKVKSVVPMIAMPSAEPICRVVELVPEAMPARGMSTSASVTLASCAVANPTPTP